MKLKKLLLGFALLASMLFAGGNIAPVEPIVEAPQVMSEETEKWKFNLAPFYLWAMGMDGQATIGENVSEVDVDFDQITDKLEAVFIVHFEGMHESNFGFMTDINYVSLGGSQSLPENTTLDVNMDMTIAEFSGLSRMQYEEDTFDLIAGVRYVKIDMGLNITSGAPINGLNLSPQIDWVDPLIGARWMRDINEEWSLLVRGDIGGFGISSDFTWQALGLVEWKPYENTSFIAGYRVLDLDYEEGSGDTYFRYDVRSQGPLIGVNFRW